jgi:hypothetical protein
MIAGGNHTSIRLTERNLNFANGKMQIDSRILLHVKALFCDIAKVALLQYPAGRVILILIIRQERVLTNEKAASKYSVLRSLIRLRFSAGFLQRRHQVN